jgi:hypothetical protein
MARPKFKFAVHASIKDAARWHETSQRELGRRETAADIEAILHGIRAFHRSKY